MITQSRKVAKFALVSLLLLTSHFSLRTFGQTNAVLFPLSDFGLNATQNRTVLITPIQIDDSGTTNLIVADRFSTNSGSGTFIRMMLAGYYQVDLLAPPSSSRWIIQVTNSAQLENAASIRVRNTNSTSASFTYQVTPQSVAGQITSALAAFGSTNIATGVITQNQANVSLYNLNVLGSVNAGQISAADIGSSGALHGSGLSIGAPAKFTIDSSGNVASAGNLALSSITASGSLTGNGGGLTNLSAVALGNDQSWGRGAQINTVSAIGQQSRPFRWLSFGDSVATEYGGWGTNGWVIDCLQAWQKSFGVAGYFGPGAAYAVGYFTANPFWKTVMIATLAGQVTNSLDPTCWYGSFYRSTGNGTSFTIQFTPNTLPGNGIVANVGKVYYLATNNGAPFYVYTNMNGGAFTGPNGSSTPYGPIATDTVGGACTGAVYNVFSNAAAVPMTILVSNSTPNGKTLNIVGAALLDTTKNGGIVYGQHTWGGADLSTWCGVPTNIYGPIFADWAPDLITVAVYDSGTIWQNYYTNLYNFLTNWCPRSDVVMIGMPSPTNDAAGMSGIVAQNSTMRAIAPLTSWGFSDLSSAVGGSQSNMFARGWVTPASSPHPTDVGSSLYAGWIYRWLNLESASPIFANQNATNQVQSYLASGAKNLTNLVVQSATAGGGNGDPMSIGAQSGGAGIPAIYYVNNGTYYYLAIKGGPGGGGFGGVQILNTNVNQLNLGVTDAGDVTVGHALTVTSGSTTAGLTNSTLTAGSVGTNTLILADQNKALVSVNATNNLALGTQVGVFTVTINGVVYKIPLYR